MVMMVVIMMFLTHGQADLGVLLGEFLELHAGTAGVPEQLGRIKEASDIYSYTVWGKIVTKNQWFVSSHWWQSNKTIQNYWKEKWKKDKIFNTWREQCLSNLQDFQNVTVFLSDFLNMVPVCEKGSDEGRTEEGVVIQETFKTKHCWRACLLDFLFACCQYCWLM